MREGVTENVTPVTKSVTCAECVRLRAEIRELEGAVEELLGRLKVAKTGAERMREYRKRKRGEAG
jgi:hypothetical protein